VVLKLHVYHASHHVFTINNHIQRKRFSQNTLKNSSKTLELRPRHDARKKSHTRKKNKRAFPKIYLSQIQKSDLRAASRTIPTSASPWAVERKAASNWLGGSQTPASSMAR